MSQRCAQAGYVGCQLGSRPIRYVYSSSCRQVDLVSLCSQSFERRGEGGDFDIRFPLLVCWEPGRKRGCVQHAKCYCFLPVAGGCLGAATLPQRLLKGGGDAQVWLAGGLVAEQSQADVVDDGSDVRTRLVAFSSSEAALNLSQQVFGACTWLLIARCGGRGINERFECVQVHKSLVIVEWTLRLAKCGLAHMGELRLKPGRMQCAHIRQQELPPAKDYLSGEAPKCEKTRIAPRHRAESLQSGATLSVPG